MEASAWIKVSVEKLGLQDKQGPLDIIQDQQGWYSMWIDFGIPLYIPGLAIFRTR